MAQRQRIFYKPELKAERRYARKHLSPAESALWQAMRCGRAGVRCRRKASIGEHIVDFYIAGQKLAVDIVKIGDDVVARHAKAQSLKQHKVDLLCLQQEDVLVDTAGAVLKISGRAGCLQLVVPDGLYVYLRMPKKSADWLAHNDKKLKTLAAQLADNGVQHFDPEEYLNEVEHG